MFYTDTYNDRIGCVYFTKEAINDPTITKAILPKIAILYVDFMDKFELTRIIGWSQHFDKALDHCTSNEIIGYDGQLIEDKDAIDFHQFAPLSKNTVIDKSLGLDCIKIDDLKSAGTPPYCHKKSIANRETKIGLISIPSIKFSTIKGLTYIMALNKNIRVLSSNYDEDGTTITYTAISEFFDEVDERLIPHYYPHVRYYNDVPCFTFKKKA